MTYAQHADAKGFSLPRWEVTEYAALPGDVVRHLVRSTDPESEPDQFDLDCRHNAWLLADRLNYMTEKYRWLLTQREVPGMREMAKALYDGAG
jgi:hypothetical protein